MQIIRPLTLLFVAAACQSHALAAGSDTGGTSDYARVPAPAPAPASVPEVPGYQLPRENPMPDEAKLLGAPSEVGASAPDDDNDNTTRDTTRRTKPIVATTPPHRHDVLPNPWPPAWSSTSGRPAYRNPW
ncbi:hypothetical protein [Paraburkholderia adhaesiva]|uniref:hypothetical protein n=1 Tax=Paraburkholderia adhaesiva TaxID=2883244 RepID=UPI001F286287|nr:hypothetical protein [Paraburkholderia adhaesiva]